MKYVHPDVLDSILLYVRNNASRVLLIPAYTPGMSDLEAVTSALLSTSTVPANFALSSEGTGRKMVFSGVSVMAESNVAASEGRHIALVSNDNKVLWAVPEIGGATIFKGQIYKFGDMILVSPAPEQS